MKRHAAVLALTLVAASASPRIARADPPAPHGDTTTGWIVVASSIAAGAAITTVALTSDCAPADTRCGRWTSLGIWGGVGVAAFGSVAGIVLVEKESRRVAIAGPALVGTF